MSTNQKNPTKQNQGTQGRTSELQGSGAPRSDGQQWNAQGSQQGQQRGEQVSPYPRTQGQDGDSYPGLHGNQAQGAGVERDMQRSHPQGVAREEERSLGQDDGDSSSAFPGNVAARQEETGLSEHDDEQARDLHEEVQHGKPTSATPGVAQRHLQSREAQSPEQQRPAEKPQQQKPQQQSKKGSRQPIEGRPSQPHTSHR